MLPSYSLDVNNELFYSHTVIGLYISKALHDHKSVLKCKGQISNAKLKLRLMLMELAVIINQLKIMNKPEAYVLSSKPN